MLPFLRWWPLVNRDTLKADFYAGLTGAVVVLPQGVAFALIAGLPPQYGLYSAMVPPIIAGLFGSSRHLISGPTTAISLVVFAAVSKFAEPGSAKFISLALTLTLLAGVYQLVLGLIRMGALVNFISHSVVVGFTAGAALLIITSQFRHLFGLQIPPGESFLHTWQDLYLQFGDINAYITAVAAITLISLIVLVRLRPRWPGMLIAMIIGALFAELFILVGNGSHAITFVGELPAQLPSPSLPDLSLGSLKQLGSASLAIALLGLVEAVAISRSIGARSGQRISGNQEFIGQGLANIVGSCFSSYASSGSFTRSGINFSAGAVTPLSGIFAALCLAVILLVAGPLTAHLPMATMAGILLVVAWRLIDFHNIKIILATSKREAAVLLTTFLATLFIDLEFAIFVGVLLSLIIYLMRTSRPGIVSRVPDPNTARRHLVTDASLPECPQLKIVRVDGSLFFGAVDHVHDKLHLLYLRNPHQKHMLMVGNGINFIDISGAELLIQEAKRRRKLGGGLYLAKVKDEVCSIFKRGGFADEFGIENIFVTKGDAIESIFKKLDREICAKCDKRIFLECQQLPAPATEGAKA